MIKKYLILLFFSWQLVLLAQESPLAVFEKAVYHTPNGQDLPYCWLAPTILDDTIIKIPLVIFLHGAGERGIDNEQQLLHGSSLFTTKQSQEKYPAFVIFPQCPEDKKWVEVDWTKDSHDLPQKITALLEAVLQLSDSLSQRYPIDTNRIYVMGLSMGGFGTWDLISRFPQKFAAAVPICGGGDEKQAKQLVNIPIWAFHGEKDKLVKPSRTKNMVNAIQKCGGKPKFTEYKGVGHLCWVKTFEEPNLLDWLFSNSLRP